MLQIQVTLKGPFSLGGASGRNSIGRTGVTRPLCRSTFTFPRPSMSLSRFMLLSSEIIWASFSCTFISFKALVAFCRWSLRAACSERPSCDCQILPVVWYLFLIKNHPKQVVNRGTSRYIPPNRVHNNNCGFWFMPISIHIHPYPN